MRTWEQFVLEEYKELRREYPEACCDDLREIATSGTRRQMWVEEITAAMRKGTPSRQQWPWLLKELGRDYICRRVFHDEPDSAGRYLAAGLLLPKETT